MKYLFTLIITLFAFSLTGNSQTFQQKKKRSEVFGERKTKKEKVVTKYEDKVKPWGVYFQVGPTVTTTKSTNTFLVDNPLGGRLNVHNQADGRWGLGAEFGMLRFNIKSPKSAYGRIVDYFDFGMSIRAFRGFESTILDSIPVSGPTITNYQSGEGDLQNLYLTFRFGVHKLQYLTKTKNYFIDHGLGLTANFLASSNTRYDGHFYPNAQQFQSDFSFQLHYDFGLGFRLSRGKYLVPGIELPLLGYHNSEFGNAKIDWFSSQYYPMFIKVKYIQLLKAKLQKNGCFIGSEEDRKRDQNMRQNM